MRKIIFLVVVALGFNVVSAFAQSEKWYDVVKSGNLEKVQSLIDNGMDVNAVYAFGLTALMWVTDEGHTEIAEFLIANGADVHAVDYLGKTALMLASIDGDSETAEFLIAQGVDVNVVDYIGRTALMWASIEGHTETAELLTANRTELNVIDIHGNTSLDHAKKALEYHTKEFTEDPDSAENHLENIRNSGKVIALLNAHGAKCNSTC